MHIVRILLQGRRTRGDLRGGDASLTTRLSEELTARGHSVLVTPDVPPDDREWDIVHGVNLDRSVLPQTEAFARFAARVAAPFVLTPLWWPLSDMVKTLTPRERVVFALKAFPPARFLRERHVDSLRTISSRQHALLAVASIVAPSGALEEQALRRHFAIETTQVVHYGTDITPKHGGNRDGVVCVARLDPRKNQLNLIRALRGTGVALRLIGTDRVFPQYAHLCREAADDLVSFDGFLPPEDVVEAFRCARVHALPSAFELPGLVTLDAAAAGAAVVASACGTARDYLGSEAVYTTTDAISIREAVLTALESGPPQGLAERVAGRWTWAATAAGFEAVYRRALDNWPG